MWGVRVGDYCSIQQKVIWIEMVIMKWRVMDGFKRFLKGKYLDIGDRFEFI